jgi:hypothetical protein
VCDLFNTYICELVILTGLSNFKIKIIEFSRQISKQSQLSDFINIRPVEAELFHSDGQTDRQAADITKLTIAFRNFANAPKNCIHEEINSRLSSVRA